MLDAGAPRRGLSALLACLALLAGCSGAGTTERSGILPAGGFDYQLGDAYDADVAVVVRDAGAAPMSGVFSICYVNGFQTQPGQAELWEEHRELMWRGPDGAVAVDPDWPDEMILDPSTPQHRDAILEILGPVIDGCADAGFDAVEIDNLDVADRVPGLDEESVLALAGAYAERAHGSGLQIAQKNAPGLSRRAHDELGMDLAIVEECGAYDECAAYTEVYGPDVLQIEYLDSLAESGTDFRTVCASPDRAERTILRDRALVGPEEAGYVFETC